MRPVTVTRVLAAAAECAVCAAPDAEYRQGAPGVLVLECGSCGSRGLVEGDLNPVEQVSRSGSSVRFGFLLDSRDLERHEMLLPGSSGWEAVGLVNAKALAESTRGERTVRDGLPAIGEPVVAPSVDEPEARGELGGFANGRTQFRVHWEYGCSRELAEELGLVDRLPEVATFEPEPIEEELSRLRQLAGEGSGADFMEAERDRMREQAAEDPAGDEG